MLCLYAILVFSLLYTTSTSKSNNNREVMMMMISYIFFAYHPLDSHLKRTRAFVNTYIHTYMLTVCAVNKGKPHVCEKGGKCVSCLKKEVAYKKERRKIENRLHVRLLSHSHSYFMEI